MASTKLESDIQILLAEDDAVSRLVLKRLIGNLNYPLTLFSDGQAAFDYFVKARPPIVISDWMMPGLDGLELCRHIRELSLEHYTYFILQTAVSGHEKYREAMDHGVDDFLKKPIQSEDLFLRLRVAERIIRQRWAAEHRVQDLARFPAENPNPVLQVSRDGRILYANVTSQPLLTEWRCEVGGTVPQSLAGLLHEAFGSTRQQETEIECAGRVFSFAANPVVQNDWLYLYGHDITARKQAEQELVILKNRAVEMSLHDQLTGLPNRALLSDRLGQGLAHARRHGHKLALVMVDIDNFKYINDTHGHKVGDQLIILVGHTLRDTLRSSDTVCRWGGDEMVLLLDGLESRETVPGLCAKLSQAVKLRAAESDLAVHVTLSMGSVVFPDDAATETLLMQRADQALYEAKAAGRDCWREYRNDTGNSDQSEQGDLFRRLSIAVQRQQIQAYFQPIVSAQTGEVVGVEALARWQDAELGWVSPDRFIPLAEAKGLIMELGHQVLTQALDQLGQWRHDGRPLTVSINLSKRQILDPDFCANLTALVSQRQLRPEWIILEVTERQSLLGHALGRQCLEALALAGFRLSLDDFGSGHSSFDMVGDLPFHELKVAMQLTRKFETLKGRGILQAILEMCCALGLKSVVEGVEDARQAAFLRRLGAHKLQGYHYSKPLSAEALSAFLSAPQAAAA